MRATEEEKLGDAPIEPPYREMLNVIARAIDKFINGSMPRDTSKDENGFILMMFPFKDHEGRCNYISNARRADVVVLLREQLARFEGMPEAKGRG